MSIIGSNILAGASGQGGGYTIEESLRFNASQSSYLSWTPASAGNRTTWTMSMWVKRGSLGTKGLFSTINSGSVNTTVGFNGDTIDFLEYQSATVARLITTPVFRDSSAWYHIVAVWDSSNSTSTERVRLYVNGSRITALSTATYPTQNLTSIWNNNVSSSIGTYNNGSPPQLYLDGYLTEVNFIDGQALDASSFGETDATTGVWKPKGYTGTYGTNGFYLNFSNASTTTTLGYDYSGQSNNWLLNNFSLTGTAYCSMTDTPTPYLGGGNYAVLNPLAGSTSVAFSNANLKVTSTDDDFNASYSSIGVTSGKWYAEISIDFLNTSTNTAEIGVGSYIYPRDSSNMTGTATGITMVNLDNSLAAYRAVVVDGTALSGGDSGFSFVNGDVVGIALDADEGQVTFYKNGAVLGATYPYSVTLLSGSAYYFMTFARYTTSFSANFGQRPFAYTPPTGFKALHTGNLPDSNIVDGSKHFDVSLWNGNNSTQNIINAGGFQPDLVWWKRRDTAAGHGLADAVRGSTKSLSSSSTGGDLTTTDGFVGFNSDGFALNGPGSSNYDTNYTGGSYVGWQWKANGTGVSNTDGSITSTVSANPTAGFSVVTFTNPSSGSGSIEHGLGVKPSMVIVKARNNTSNWTCMHKSLGANMADKWINLESTAGVQTSTNIWGGEPTSSVFYCGTGIQVASATMVAYCFAEVEGYSKFGSYLGNNSSDGVFVYLGFRPRFLMIKSTSAGTEWVMIDTERISYNLSDTSLYANRAYSEATITAVNDVDILSNGFKLRNNTGYVNASQTYIYMAFAETDFAHALAR